MHTKTEVIVNIILHIFILFVILSGIFWLVIAKVEKEIITNEINSKIEDGFSEIKKRISDTDRKGIRDVITKIDGPLNVLKKLYSTEDRVTTINNKMVQKMNGLYIILILSILFTILLSIFFTCNYYNFPFFGIFKENIVLFTGIAIVEYLFFTKIAMKYIPTTPSDVFNNVIDELKKL